MKRVCVFIITLFLLFGTVACGETTSSELTTVVNNSPVFSGIENKVIEIDESIVLTDGITVIDVEDGDLTPNIEVNSGDFDNSVVGEYVIALSVEDVDGNITESSFTVTVIVIEFTSQDWVEFDLDNIELSIPLTLPESSGNGTTFEWASSNPLVITDAGYIINPHVGANSIDVMLTCTATNSSYSTTESFVLTIQPNPEVNVTSKDNYDFTGTSEEYIVDSSTVDLYFVDNGSVPYIDVQTFIDMVNGAIESDIITIATESDNALTLDYQYEYTDFDGVTVLYEDYSAIIDFDENTFTVNNFDFFSGYVAETESDYGEGLEYVDAFYIDGEEVVIPLGDYNFDLIIYDDGGNTVYLMPFHIINLLLLGNVYYDAYYNGDEIFGIDTFSMSGGDQDIIDQIHDTSYNSNEEVPRDMSLATYNFMAFVIDYFYGLKEDKNLNGYDFMIENAESMIEQSNDELYKRIFDVAYRLDDLHTSHVFTGYYDSSYLTNDYAVQLSWDDLGPGYVEFLNGLYDVQDLLEVKYPSGIIPDYELLDDETKAVIHLTGFTIDTPDEFKAILDNLPLTVEDVVIDLSYNTGGNLGAVLRIYGYITEETLTYHSQNPVDDSAATFYFESDYVAYDYNFYMLTSSVTFSAANLFANMAKEQGIPIVGQDSSGGASSIGFITSPDGSGLLVSSLNILSTRIGDTEETYQYLSIENGISVDYLMDNCTSDFELITIIDQIRAEEIN